MDELRSSGAFLGFSLFLGFFFYFGVPFFFFFIRFNSTKLLCFLFVIEEISSNDDAYIHAWDGASCRQNLLSTYN